MRVVDHIISNAEKWPEKVALIEESASLTYKEFAEAILRRATSFDKKDSVISFATIPLTNYIIDYFAIQYSGNAAMPLAIQQSETASQASQQLLLAHPTVPAGTAEVLFTTGTTGQSKGVMVSHDAIMANAENLIEAQGFTEETTFIICGPLNHIGSLSKVYTTFAAGGTVVLTEGLKDVNVFFRALDLPYNKMATFLVPTNIRMLLKFSKERLAKYADKIDFIETGAAAISSDDMEELCNVLPRTRLFNTYASTETGIIATFNYNSGECIAGCLGRPMRNSQISISEEGLISCSGRTLMTGYLGDEALTKTVLHDGAVHTQDIGSFDSAGRLRLVGRQGDVINAGGYKISPLEVENVAMQCPGVADCILIGFQHPIVGTALKLLVVPAPGSSLTKKEVAFFLKERLETYKVPQLYDFVDHVERTFNGKLDRKAYLGN